MEEQRLQWIQFNQKTICRKKNLDDTIAVDGGVSPGKPYLPAGSLGLRRHQQQMIADALAIVTEYGKPTYFITMTRNPEWPEIEVGLKQGQNAANRPDIVTRDFIVNNSLLLTWLPEILNGKDQLYRFHVIEFQKRGLPHAHIAVKMSEYQKRQTKAIVSADKTAHPRYKTFGEG